MWAQLENVSIGRENKIVTVNRKFASKVRIQNHDILAGTNIEIQKCARNN